MKVKDGDWELIDHDERLGRTVWRYFDGQQTHYRTDYRVDNVIKDNAIARSEMQGARWKEGRRIASIPLNTYFAQLADAQVQGDEKYISRWLNDGDNAAFRTFEGKV